MSRRIINRRPGRGGRIFWGAAPFIAAVIVYFIFSALRLAENPNDKLLPGLTAFGAAIQRMGFAQDMRTGQILLWDDTLASLGRLGVGLAVATVLGLVFGIATGVIPYVRAGLSPFIAVASMVPPMAILPILFIVFGLDELSKVVLIVIGITPFLIRDLAMRVGDMPGELLIKAQTLGASTWQIILRVVLPQIAPRLAGRDPPIVRAGLVVSDFSRGDRRDGWAGLSDIPDAPLFGDGCHPALCCLDYVPGVHDGLGAARLQSALLPLADDGGGVSQVSVRNLWMEYPDQIVLERINLEIASGEFCVLIGPSGCGKTTFLRLLLSMEQPTHGEILLDGRKLPGEPGPDRGVVFQRYSVFPHLTVVENVILGLEFAGSRLLGKLYGAARRLAVAKAEHQIESVGLSAARDKYPGQLSGGMQQRLAIAQTLIRKPKVLLLDEPFGALDPGTKVQMYELITRLWREEKVTIFMVTHDLKEAFTLATRVLTFDKMRVDPDAPGAYGATVTFDLPLGRRNP